MAEGGCHVCATVESANDETRVYQDADWTVVTFRNSPGVLMMATNRHDTGLASLSPSAQASLGALVSAISKGLTADGTYDRVAFLHMGDNSIHTHFALIARNGPGAPWGDPLGELSGMMARVQNVDEAHTLALRDRIRANLGQR